jgi:hypothetical protein
MSLTWLFWWFGTSRAPARSFPSVIFCGRAIMVVRSACRGQPGRPRARPIGRAAEWLRQVKIGTLQTAPQTLAEIAWKVSQHYMMLARELLMEEIRVEEFSGSPPSRQRCLYLSETVEESRTWLPLLGGNGAVCELTCTGALFIGRNCDKWSC